MNGMMETLVKKHGNTTFVGIKSGNHFIPRMEHLACFVPGIAGI